MLLDNALSSRIGSLVALSGIGRVLAMTSNSEVNTLVTLRSARQFGRENIFHLADPQTAADTAEAAEEEERHLFALGVTHRRLSQVLEAGGVVQTTRLDLEFDFAAYSKRFGPRALPLFVVNERREMTVVTNDIPVSPRPGDTLISLIASDTQASLNEIAQSEAGVE